MTDPFHPRLRPYQPPVPRDKGPENRRSRHQPIRRRDYQGIKCVKKSDPGELNYATAGVGSFQHLASELFKLQAGVDIVHIPFKGGGPAMMDVIAGNTQIAIGSLVQMLPQIKAGKLKALGVGSANRIAAVPDLPTISEAGVPGYEVTNWWGIVVPAGTPRSVIDRLHNDLTVVVASPETKKRFERGRRTAVDEPGRIRTLHRCRKRKVGARGEGRRDPRRVTALRQLQACCRS